MPDFRYRYLGDRLTDPRWRGRLCNPVRRADGKCIVGRSMGSALVEMDTGEVLVVNRRCLRLLSKEAVRDAM